MTDTSSTPGPWQLIRSQPNEGWDGFHLLAQPAPFMRGFTKQLALINGPQNGEAEATARLIAAAPDLLAALQGVLRVADRKTVEFDAARAAIARATGQDGREQ